MSATLPASLETPAAEPRLPRGKDALIVFAACFASGQILGMLGGLATVAWLIATKQPLNDIWALFSSPFLILVTVVDGAVSVLVVWFFGCRPFGRSLLEGVDLRARPLGWTIAAPFAGLALALPVLVLPQTADAPMHRIFAQPGGFLFIAVAAVTLPISEEIYYRGFMQPVIRRGLGRAWAIVLVTLWFGAIHAPQLFGAWTDLAYVAFAGFLWTLLREASGSTLPSLLMHWTYNASLVALTVFLQGE